MVKTVRKTSCCRFPSQIWFSCTKIFLRMIAIICNVNMKSFRAKNDVFIWFLLKISNLDQVHKKIHFNWKQDENVTNKSFINWFDVCNKNAYITHHNSLVSLFYLQIPIDWKLCHFTLGQKWICPNVFFSRRTYDLLLIWYTENMKTKFHK